MPWTLVLHLAAVVALVAVMLAVSAWVGERHQERATGEPYESGMIPTGSARLRFAIPYYQVALFFLVFDVEAAFLFAWAVAVREVGWPGFVGAMVFIGALLLALVYLARVGALDWGRAVARRAPAAEEPPEAAPARPVVEVEA